MNLETNNDKPCLVDTGQGLSVLYKGRFLYSRFNPSQAAERLAQNSQIRENTLILCCSPVLGYGLETLASRLPKNCFVLILEADKELYNIYDTNKIPKNFGIISPEQLSNLHNLINKKNSTTSNGIKIPHQGTFRRCLRLDFSGGTNLYNKTYEIINQNIDILISSFWKNRMTLVKMGRLYHKNFFRNLWKTPFCSKYKSESINKPILIVGAGTSSDLFLDLLKEIDNIDKEKIYIIAVDAAFTALLQRNIQPDAVIAQESQYAINRAYLGTKNTKTRIYADLSSRHSLLDLSSSKDIVFYSTEFASTFFWDNLRKKDLLPKEIIPLGSVGNTATEIALNLRENENIPIFTIGLDFSFPAGQTHCKGSMQHKNVLINTNRINPIGNPSSAFNVTSKKINNESDSFYTDYTLFGYAQLFNTKYSKIENLYTLTNKGINLGIPYIQNESFFDLIKKINTNTEQTFVSNLEVDKTKLHLIKEFYEQEEKDLLELRDALSYGTKKLKEIEKILLEKEYLYLHFPDGYELSTETQFLKRVRAEIDFFLKQIKIAKANISNK